jgi:hypothetical protein
MRKIHADNVKTSCENATFSAKYTGYAASAVGLRLTLSEDVNLLNAVCFWACSDRQMSAGELQFRYRATIERASPLHYL